MRQFDGSRPLEVGDADALRIDGREDVIDGAILAAGIHALQDHQHLVLVAGVEHLLLQADLGCQALHGGTVGFLVAAGERLGGGFTFLQDELGMDDELRADFLCHAVSLFSL